MPSQIRNTSRFTIIKPVPISNTSNGSVTENDDVPFTGLNTKSPASFSSVPVSISGFFLIAF
jgi:hypothetical protein